MKKISLLALCCILLLLSACKKNELGGKARIHGKVTHHSKKIPNARVFIKFNAKEFPGTDTSQYDAKVSADAEGQFSFNCYKGDYYLYGVGFDYDTPAPYIVDGGTPVRIRNKEELEIELAVTEE